jgi:hypothetical protein
MVTEATLAEIMDSADSDIQDDYERIKQQILRLAVIMARP